MKKLLVFIFTVTVLLHNENVDWQMFLAHPAIAEYMKMTSQAYSAREIRDSILEIQQEIYSETLAYMMSSPEYISDIVKGRVKDLVFRIEADSK